MSVRRLFFALWPSAGMQSDLAAATRVAVGSVRGGRTVPSDSLHLTLAFLGSVPEAAIEAVQESARAVCPAPGSARRPLDLTLDTLDYWARSQVLCAIARAAPAAGAAELAEGLKQALITGGFSPDPRPFRAHVTLARHVSDWPTERAIAPVRWTFSDFALVESRTGPGGSLYSVLDSWPLCRA